MYDNVGFKHPNNAFFWSNDDKLCSYTLLFLAKKCPDVKTKTSGHEFVWAVILNTEL